MYQTGGSTPLTPCLTTPPSARGLPRSPPGGPVLASTPPVQDNPPVGASPPCLASGDPMPGVDLLPLQQWIARELHDVVVQPLTSTMVELDLAQHQPAGPPADRAQVLQRELRGVLHGLR